MIGKIVAAVILVLVSLPFVIAILGVSVSIIKGIIEDIKR